MVDPVSYDPYLDQQQQIEKLNQLLLGVRQLVKQVEIFSGVVVTERDVRHT